MTIRWIALVALALTVGSGCASLSAKRTHKMVGCARTERAGQFDSRCDMPVLGYSGFTAP